MPEYYSDNENKLALYATHDWTSPINGMCIMAHAFEYQRLQERTWRYIMPKAIR